MPGSVVFDMAVESGGNVEGSETDRVILRNGVKIIGISNLASKVSSHASLALSNNFNNWITEFLDKDCLLYTSPSPRDGLLSRMPSSA